MKRYRVTIKANDGSVQRTTLLARSADEAREFAKAAHDARASRFDRTFANIERAKETGEPGMLALSPLVSRMGKQQLAAWAEREEERRKRDAARYFDGDLDYVKVEEVKP